MIIKKFKSKLQKTYWLFVLFILFLPVGNVFAQTRGGGPGPSTELKNPIKVDSIQQFLSMLLEVVVKIAGPIVVLMIVYSGFLFIKAQGNPEELTKARQAIMWTVIGAIIVLGAFAISKAIEGTVKDLKQGVVNSSYIINLG